MGIESRHRLVPVADFYARRASKTRPRGVFPFAKLREVRRGSRRLQTEWIRSLKRDDGAIVGRHALYDPKGRRERQTFCQLP
jgi:hypothetical protein